MTADGLDGEATLALLRETLAHHSVRIELTFALSIHGALPCAVFYTREEGRWKKVKQLPMILPPEDGTRADLLQMFADMLKKQPDV